MGKDSKNQVSIRIGRYLYFFLQEGPVIKLYTSSKNYKAIKKADETIFEKTISKNDFKDFLFKNVHKNKKSKASDFIYKNTIVYDSDGSEFGGTIKELKNCLRNNTLTKISARNYKRSNAGTTIKKKLFSPKITSTVKINNNYYLFTDDSMVIFLSSSSKYTINIDEYLKNEETNLTLNDYFKKRYGKGFLLRFKKMNRLIDKDKGAVFID